MLRQPTIARTRTQLRVLLRHAWVVILMLACAGCGDSGNGPEIVKGQLDLRLAGESLRESPMVLRGQWHFSFQSLMDPLEFQNEIPDQVETLLVPQIWNGVPYKTLLDGLPGQGHATYALEILWPDTQAKQTSQSGTLGIWVEDVSTAHTLYAVTSRGTETLMENGKVGDNHAAHIPQWAHRVAPLPLPENGRLVLVWHVSNFTYARGGAWKAPVIGDYSTLRDEQIRLWIFSAALIGMLLIMALYHFARFCMRPSDLGSAWFTLLCVVMAVRELNIQKLTELLPFEVTAAAFSWFVSALFLSSQLAGPALMSFVSIAFPSPGYRRLTLLGWIVTIPFFVVSLFGNPEAISKVSPSYYPVVVLQIATTVSYLAVCVARKRAFAWVALLGCVVLGLGAVHDMFHAHGLVGQGFISTYCFALFVVLESYFLAAHSSMSHHRLEKSRQGHLDKIKAQLETSRLEKELTGALRTKIHIFGNVAHELNNPLNYLTLGADGCERQTKELQGILEKLLAGAGESEEGRTVQREIDKKIEGIRKNLAIVHDGSQTAATVVAEMRGLAEVDGAVREMMTVSGLLDGAMRRVRADQQPEVFSQVTFDDTMGSLDREIEGNPYMLIHAISHVIINAVRFSVKSEGKPTVWLAARTTASSWVLSIQNNGPAVCASAIGDLLEPKAMGESNRNLPVAHSLLKEQGGTLRLCDTGQITGRVIFELELPLAGHGSSPRTLHPEDHL